MNKELREKLRYDLETIHAEYMNYEWVHTKEYMWDFLITDKVIKLFEQEIIEAERRGEARIKKEWDFAIRSWMTKKEMKIFIQSL